MRSECSNYGFKFAAAPLLHSARLMSAAPHNNPKYLDGLWQCTKCAHFSRIRTHLLLHSSCVSFSRRGYIPEAWTFTTALPPRYGLQSQSSRILQSFSGSYSPHFFTTTVLGEREKEKKQQLPFLLSRRRTSQSQRDFLGLSPVVFRKPQLIQFRSPTLP
jgi:hypothetical protein